MNIVIEFEDPGTYNYSIFKIQNYEGREGLSYVLGASFGSNFATDPMNSIRDRIDHENLERIILTNPHFNGLTKSEIYDSVRRELEIIEGVKKTSKFEDLSDGEFILERVAESHLWAKTATLEGTVNFEGSGKTYPDAIISVRESAIPNTLFRVSKKPIIKKSRKVIPMKSNLKFKH